MLWGFCFVQSCVVKSSSASLTGAARVSYFSAGELWCWCDGREECPLLRRVLRATAAFAGYSEGTRVAGGRDLATTYPGVTSDVSVVPWDKIDCLDVYVNST